MLYCLFFFIFDEIAELALFREAVLFNLHRIRIEILQQLSPRLFKVTNTVLGITLSHCWKVQTDYMLNTIAIQIKSHNQHPLIKKLHQKLPKCGYSTTFVFVYSYWNYQYFSTKGVCGWSAHQGSCFCWAADFPPLLYFGRPGPTLPASWLLTPSPNFRCSPHFWHFVPYPL